MGEKFSEKKILGKNLRANVFWNQFGIKKFDRFFVKKSFSKKKNFNLFISISRN